MSLFVWTLLAATSSGLEPSSLRTLALSSQRPGVCRSSSFGDAELWSASRGGTARRYCLLLARGYARLALTPAEALSFGESAHALLTDDAEAQVLMGRAALRLGEFPKAYALLSGHVRARSRPLGDLAALRELGVAALATSNLAQAAEAYRALMPRVSFSQAPSYSQTIALEAASALMATGPGGLADAALFLSEARRHPSPPGSEELLLALSALALEREGRREQSQALVAELSGPWSLERHLTARDRQRILAVTSGEPVALPPITFSPDAPQLAEGELHAAIAVAAFQRDPKLARLHLKAYLLASGEEGGFAAWARERASGVKRAKAP